VVAFYDHGDELSFYIKGRIFFCLISDYQILQKDSSPWNSAAVVSFSTT